MNDPIQIELTKDEIDSFHANIYSEYDNSRPNYVLCKTRFNILNCINDLWQNYLIDIECDRRLSANCSIKIETIPPQHTAPYKMKYNDDDNDDNNLLWNTPLIGNTKKMIIRKYVTGPIINSITIPSAVLFGSIASGIDNKDSDIDIALPAGIKYQTVNSHHDTRFQQNLLRDFLHIFQLKSGEFRLKYGFKFKIEPILHARVPIIKLIEKSTLIAIDIGIKSTQMPITKLISYYCGYDDRIRVFISTIKYWSKRRKISDAQNGFPNSFGFVLLCIKYLQELRIPILPVVRRVYSPHNIILQSDLNTQTLCELLISFFDYYFHFNFNKYEISITKYGLQYKQISNYNLTNPSSQSTLLIQDPLSVNENVTRCIKKYNLKILKYELFRAYKCVQNNNYNLLMKLYEKNASGASDDNIFNIYKPINKEEMDYQDVFNKEQQQNINKKQFKYQYYDNNKLKWKNKNKNKNKNIQRYSKKKQNYELNEQKF